MEVPSINKQKKFWDDWVMRSFSWEDNADNKRRFAYVLKEVERLNLDKLKILDVGCGSGWLSRQLSKYGEVTAIDLSYKTIHKLKNIYPSINWIDGDFLSIELPEKYFDAVTCLETISHVPDQAALAGRIARLTKPGGILLLTSQNEYIWSRTSSLRPPGDGQIRNWISRSRLIELFETHFVIERMTTCAPGGDMGMPGIINSRIGCALGRRLFGDEQWTQFRERCGIGRSLFLFGRRNIIIVESA